ncbi:cytochrome c oxidase subunit 4 [Actinomadura craniellae]|uniref:Cytochrome c oxidase polypeptide 4 n=1 Tax=Actinomadura craniellae TaxID=2231787 RepID=A0A365H210_9ACTN|nr:cytochrome c oxidase subunit 4 [Actinomadura craniellae]RAY13130.1 cytochrome c oxidase subunit 4 [Actinomadura craniellae]
MRVQAFMFYGCAVFFLAVDVVYWLWSKEWVGTTALALSTGLALLIAFYIHFTIRRVEKHNGGPLPEDNKTGEIAESAGELGFFSPHSWWPLYLAGSAALVTFGMAFSQWWLALTGGALVLMSSIGLVFEYYRGNSDYYQETQH